jgi:hypothetical protein
MGEHMPFPSLGVARKGRKTWYHAFRWSQAPIDWLFVPLLAQWIEVNLLLFSPMCNSSTT